MRQNAQTEFEKGKLFEKLCRIYLLNDDIQQQYFSNIWFYDEWANLNNKTKRDVGIDLVGEFTDGSGLVAIQAKFYAPTHSITKADIDSFISAASSGEFEKLILIDTTTRELSPNARNVLDAFNGGNSYNRISIAELERSRIDWDSFVQDGVIKFTAKKSPRPHQSEALTSTEQAFQTVDRGKIIMACGTGKTYTSLIIAEKLAGKGKRVLYMVPSLALMSQTVREWKQDCTDDFIAYSACSDTNVGKKKSNDDIIELNVSDLAFPATTKANKIADQVNNADPEKMTVVFSTYQSVQVIENAQKQHGLPEFDLIICDEAHRTTGVTLEGDDESNFIRIHDNQKVTGKKRLYMTATPRIFGEGAKKKAGEISAELASMDDESIFGPTIYYKGFSWAVENNLLTDYKVVVLAMDEGEVSASIQNRLASDNELKLDDATKILGCYRALTKKNLIGHDNPDAAPMKRALAFCANIAKSKMIQDEFSHVVAEYLGTSSLIEDDHQELDIDIRHIDGTFNATQREIYLDWLKEETDPNLCRILTNARCLSEGVDVPALDAVMFLHPRKSQVDVVQSVGRVMRKAEGKKLGYVILPIAVPANVPAHEALNDNETYRVVWQILNALRAHDERFDALTNRLDLGEDHSDKLEFIDMTSHQELRDITAVVDDIKTDKPQKASSSVGNNVSEGTKPHSMDHDAPKFVFDDFTRAIRAKIVAKCGTREYWEDWAKDIAKIAQTHIARITSIVEKQNSDEAKIFTEFLTELRDDLNPSVSKTDTIEMLAQHLITKPVFDALFKDHNFTTENPVSMAMNKVINALEEHNINKEADTLQGFYDSVRRRAEGIETPRGRQELVVQLYDKFFRSAFPRLTEQLGIVYTPVEVVDFIIHSVNDVLKDEFDTSLGAKGVHILDPFTGTGTFITRLLQSGLIRSEEIEYKYKNEIHANEIVLLAYYIAAINIEAAYQDLSRKNQYIPFDGMVLTDTFQLYEQDRDMVQNLLPDNSERRTAQKSRDIRVIIGNPPYSAGQKSANDNAGNLHYPNLDQAIRDSYAAHSKMTSIKNLYDSYIRAFRWATDRIKDTGEDKGVMAFVSGSAWIERSFADGMRKTLAEDYSNLYIFHLRGDIRKNMLSKGAAGEGGNIFGSGSMTGIAISVLVRNPEAEKFGQVHFHDIGDNIDGKEKLAIVKNCRSIKGITNAKAWRKITPDENHDWLDQVDRSFDQFMVLGDKKDKSAKVIFENYSLGANTNRDAWSYNHSKHKLFDNMERMISTYNKEIEKNVSYENVINDPKLIKWSSSLESAFKRKIKGSFSSNYALQGVYRPFEKTQIYFDPLFVHRVAQMPRIFPNAEAENRVIAVSGIGARAGFSALMVDALPCLDMVEKGQCFPLYLYEQETEGGLFAGGGLSRKDAITAAGLGHFQAAYPTETINREDLFYYIYGLLHSPDYRARYKNNLMKQLPRIPAVKTADDFWAFSKAGRALADLHVNYESAAPYQVSFKEGDHRLINIDDPVQFYRVNKMKFGGKDRTTIIYNDHITLTNIPLAAYDYVVNGKPAIEWVMERQSVKVDKASGIVNDANDYANETVGDPRYPMELLQRVITVSLETMRIVEGLPEMNIN
ncbi:DEAD/DEAH box helicase family protein [Planktomarina temperata]|nr:DEAD/DEAH box helicase family protein [Planktomarina temperata]